MDYFNLAKKYNSQGYSNLETLFEDRQIEYLREVFDKTFSAKKFPERISIFDIEDEQAIEMILKALNSEGIQSMLKEISKYSNTKISVLPPFHIQRNKHVDSYKSLGWHRDCGGEFSYKYCTKKLYDKSYVMGKIGIYFQENSEFGGSIDLIPYSHRYFNPKTTFVRKLKGIPLFIAEKLHTYFKRIYKWLPEKFFMVTLSAKRMYPSIGSPVLFDSRVIHRGSPISDKVRNQVSFSSNKLSAEVPKTKIKYSLYAHFGSSLAVDSYLFDRLKRDGNSSELQTWCNEQKEIEKFFPNLASSIKDIMSSILPKYNQNL